VDERFAKTASIEAEFARAARFGQVLGVAGGGFHIWQAQWILEAAESFAAAFREVLEDDWLSLFDRPVSIPAVAVTGEQPSE
jgi:hypothetical protein